MLTLLRQIDTITFDALPSEMIYYISPNRIALEEAAGR